MKKGLISTIALGAVVLSIAGAGNAYAFKQQYRGDNGMWIQENNTRWWYQYDNGSYARNTWVRMVEIGTISIMMDGWLQTLGLPQEMAGSMLTVLVQC